MKSKSHIFLLSIVSLSVHNAFASISVDTNPVTVQTGTTPLNMLLMNRDHTLWYEAYNNVSDLNGDGVPDVGYQPRNFDYYGYFDSNKCYTYSSNGGNVGFAPAKIGRAVSVKNLSGSGTHNTYKLCSGTDGVKASYWSGDFLNYLTMSRIDILRKVLFGGKRDSQSGKPDVLARALIPQDGHTWGFQYQNNTVNGFKIEDYAPLDSPKGTSGDKYLLFANVTKVGTTVPLLRHVKTDYELYTWISREAKGKTDTNAGDYLFVPNASYSGTSVSISPTDLTVKVQACINGITSDVAGKTYTSSNDVDGVLAMDGNCKDYSGKGGTGYRPIGILQKYGEANKMLFGLMTGSFDQNTAGAVLRRDIDDLIDPSRYGHNVDYTTVNGNYLGQNVSGVIVPIQNMEIVNDLTSSGSNAPAWNCGYSDATTVSNVEKCGEWGEPTAEMFYEALRYFGASNRKATAGFVTSQTLDAANGLPEFAKSQNPAWFEQPYGSSVTGNASGNKGPFNKPYCAKGFITYFGSNSPSFDNDNLPSSLSSVFPGLNADTIGQTLWNREFGGAKDVIVGEVIGASNNDFAPTAKNASSFAKVRGVLAKPDQRGSYYTSILANYAREHGLDVPDNKVDKNGNVTATGSTTNVKINTTAVVFPPVASSFTIPVTVGGKKQNVILTPYAITVKNNVTKADGNPPITNNPLDMYIDTMANMPGMTVDNAINGGRPYMEFRVSFEDTNVGGDHDMDAIAKYKFYVDANNKIVVYVSSTYSAGGLNQHMGYTISGTTEDKIWLVVQDPDNRASDVVYSHYLDASDMPKGKTFSASDKPNEHTHTFTVSSTAAVADLKDPLYYAAKYGGYAGDAALTKPNSQTTQWDANEDGVPDSYFLINSPLSLEQKMNDAFASIMARVGSSAAVATSSTSLNNGVRLYQATFNTKDWSGDLVSIPLYNGATQVQDWSTNAKLENIASTNDRKIITYDGVAQVGVPFRWANINSAQQTALNAKGTDAFGAARLNYLRGARTGEGDQWRARSTLMGDIINSTPAYVSAPNDVWVDSDYRKFKSDYKNRKAVVYVGANDGMLHAFDANLQSVNGKLTNAATSGNELFGFIPNDLTLYNNLYSLADPNYNENHKFFVDGSPVVRDVRTTTGCTATSGYCYKTMLFGGLNSGGKSIYALDITNSDNFGTNTETDIASIVKWHFTNTDMQSSYGKPFIINSNAGNTKSSWIVVSNGLDVNSGTTNNGYLYLLSADGPQNTVAGKKEWAVNMSTTPSVIDSVKIALGTSTNGAGEVSCVDIGKYSGSGSSKTLVEGLDQKADLCYLGDPKGNVWRVDISSSSTAEWKVTNNKGTSPIFTAGINQPILSAPEITYLPDGALTGMSGLNKNLLVYVGTGQFLSSNDKLSASTNTALSTATQSIYAVLDTNNVDTTKNDVTLGRTNLEPRVIGTENNASGEAYRIVKATTNSTLCWETSTLCATADKGWYIDFPSTGKDASNNYNPSERFMGTIQLFGKNLYFSSLIPNQDVCSYGGTGWLMAVDYATGLSPSNNIFDTNNDSKIDSTDALTDNKLIAAGKKIGGSIGGANILKSVGDGQDAMAVSSLLSGELQTTTVNGKARQERTLSWKEYFR